MGSPAAPAHHHPALPAAVRKHVERANALAAEIHKKPGEPVAPGESVAPTPAAPVSEPAPPSPPAPSPSGAQQVAEPAPTPSPAPEPPKQEDSFEHKYRVLQGKYNAEVPRLQRQVQDQNDQLRQLQQQLINQQTLLASLNERRSAPQEPPAPTKLVKDEEVEQFGSDLYDFIGRAALERLLPEVEKRIAPAVQRVQQVEQTASSAATAVAKSAQQRTIEYLASHVPNYEEVNVDPKFVEWLAEVDPYSGQKRHDLLVRAYQGHDGPRVVAFFKGFLNENAVVEPPPAPTPSPAPQPAPQGTQDPLTQLVAPGAPRGTTGAPNEAGKRVWTQQEVAALYKTKNEYIKRNRPVPDELQAMERDLFKAQTEGRVRP